MEAVKTNIIGTENTLYFSKSFNSKYIFSSSDKAVDPFNVYGCTKMIAERLVLNNNGLVFRWGNIVGSRGSVIPKFINCIKKNNPINITDIDMTRFWLLIEDAVDFMVSKLDSPSGIYIPLDDMKAASLRSIIKAICEILNKDSNHVLEYVQNIFNRGGEKTHERLSSIHHDNSECYPLRNDSKTFKTYSNMELVLLIRKGCGI
jgi:UDP-glucose 4-epimerase